MLKIQKNSIDKWELLLKVLSEEIPEDNRDFQHWLNEDTENKKLYRSLKEGEQNDTFFDKGQVFKNFSNNKWFEKL